MFHDLYTNHAWFLYTLIGLVSLSVGSLLNLIIYRLPLMMQAEFLQQSCEFNLFLPRSFCPKCKTPIKAWHNIPILSYLFLGGRCKQCTQPIPIRYPLIEIGTLLLSLFACWHFGLSKQLFLVLPSLWLLIGIFFIDLDHQIIPDSLSLSLLWLGLLANSFSIFTSLPNAVYSAAAAYLSLYCFTQLFYLITGKIGMGHGDFKLFAAFGALLGYQLLPFILFFSAILGAIIGFIYLQWNKKSKDTTIPFGPYLCVTGVVCMFYGQSILNWYTSAFL